MAPLVWFITGCSSGLGECFVREVLSRGDRVVATARGDPTRLKHLEELGAHTMDLDVTATQDELNSKVKEAVERVERIDVLINSAGYFEAGVTEEVTDETFKLQFEVNFFGVLKMTRAVLPYLRKQRSGFIAFIGSPLGWKGVPGSSPYVASKFALEGVAECIRGEVAQFGIRTTIFDAGNFKTPILSPERIKYSPHTIKDYADTMQTFYGIIDYLDMKQPGDPKKGVKVMVDVIRGEGVSKGKPAPERLPLGTDMMEYIRGKCNDSLALCEEWGEISRSTDFD
ncbi:uncharacterized protein F4807DRAFT_152934 [Annulohypoxylon truncatum]|uniref:uncharacterized protein n=1 Tax=Annulohypoxylon truncatum TaxID=327061 RepID=UPI0020080A39|nr:uncharacterized protein F4807DRAFT_152934 [Annulohypoxylon truncatum]KAI1208478.1 hypothetical protein F4807DRAFT_152934 [Annulohypoxylon truncatum]